MSHDWPRRDEIWLVAVPDETKQRPCVILSADWLNQYARDVTVVPITSVARGNFPTRVPIAAGEGGLRADSWAKCDQVTTVNKTRLVDPPFGRLPAQRMRQIVDAVQMALDIG